MAESIQPPDREDVHERLQQALITGLTLTVPLLITVLVVSFVWGFVFGTLQPLTGTLQQLPGLGGTTPAILVQVLALVVVIGLIVLVGLFAETYSGAATLERRFDRAIGTIPGIGSIYQTFDEMSELILDTDTESFQEIKLVEFPTEGSYATGFVTAEAPAAIRRETGEEMLTVYVPLAPNPLMGGHVLHVSPDRCLDVDMSVEDGLKTIMTSGVAVGDEPTAEGAIEYPGDLPDDVVDASQVADTDLIDQSNDLGEDGSDPGDDGSSNHA